MSSFTKRIKKEFSFEGDTVTVVAQRMKKEDYTTMAPILKMEDGKQGVDQSDPNKVMSVGVDILKRRVESIDGLRADDGELLTVDDMLSETYFMGLVGDILGWVMESSFAAEGKKQ